MIPGAATTKLEPQLGSIFRFGYLCRIYQIWLGVVYYMEESGFNGTYTVSRLSRASGYSSTNSRYSSVHSIKAFPLYRHKVPDPIFDSKRRNTLGCYGLDYKSSVFYTACGIESSYLTFLISAIRTEV